MSVCVCVCPSDAAGLHESQERGGVALACLALFTHRPHRRRLRELVPGQEMPAHRYGVVSSPSLK